MNVGDFDTLITIKSKTGETIDSSAHPTIQYGNEIPVWSKCKEMRGYERYSAAGFDGRGGNIAYSGRVATFEFWTPPRKLLYTDVIEYDDETWDIIGISQNKKEGLVELTAQVVETA